MPLSRYPITVSRRISNRRSYPGSVRFSPITVVSQDQLFQHNLVVAGLFLEALSGFRERLLIIHIQYGEHDWNPVCSVFYKKQDFIKKILR
jgi:hypothetical protein